MGLILLGIAIFVSLVLFMEGIFLLIRIRTNPELKRIRKQLSLMTREPLEKELDISRKKRPLSDIPWLDRLLQKIPFLAKLDRVLVQADSGYPLGVFILTSGLIVLLTITVLSYFINSVFLQLLIAIGLGSLPILYINVMRRARMKKFEKQLPDALALMARAMKAGHAFSGSLQMLTSEFDNPIAGEFQKVLNEINFGIGLENALANLTERVNCPDIKFFAISVIVQRETGGNLAEILEKISALIRDRFKLQEKVRTLSAEGKMSAIILICIPVLVALALTVINPEYIAVLKNDVIGQILIAIALIMAGFGISVMKKMVSIKV